MCSWYCAKLRTDGCGDLHVRNLNPTSLQLMWNWDANATELSVHWHLSTINVTAVPLSGFSLVIFRCSLFNTFRFSFFKEFGHKGNTPIILFSDFFCAFWYPGVGIYMIDAWDLYTGKKQLAGREYFDEHSWKEWFSHWWAR